MKRLCKYTFLLICALATISLTARAIGGRHSDWPALLFTNPNGSPCQRPCLFGIRPGYTTFEESEALLNAHPITHTRNKPGAPYRISRAGDGIVIAQIDISYVTPLDSQWLPVFSLGEIVKSIGEPTFAYYNAEMANCIALFFVPYDLEVQNIPPSRKCDVPRVEPGDKAYQLGVGLVTARAAADSHYARWHGFGDVAQYVYNRYDDAGAH